MPLEAPVLDDRTFDSLVAEARALIPRYAPEWTDFNPSDPGIALIELFAYMTEILLYRINQVPERNYIKFLQMLGIERKPARPARSELTFTLSRNDIPFSIVPKGTQVAAEGEDGPVIFETDESLIALGAKLAAVQVFDGFAYSVETRRNSTPGQQFAPFGTNASIGSALMLGFDSPVDFPSQQIALTLHMSNAGVQREGTHCHLNLETLPPPAQVIWEFWDRATWNRLSIDRDRTRAFTRDGRVYFVGPGNRVRKDKVGRVTEQLYWFRARVENNTWDRPPMLERVMTNTVNATQAETHRDEVLGGSDARPNQLFRLRNTPAVELETTFKVTGPDKRGVTVRSLHLEVDEGLGFTPWQQVDDLLTAGPDDPVYVCNLTRAEIQFGDGEHGRIPAANPAKPVDNIVARFYRTGGGRKGNLPAGAVSQLQTFVQDVDSVTNFRPAFGGSDEETVAETRMRAPLALKSKSRAVTEEDFEYLARETPGVRIRRAKALPLMHPRYHGPIPGVVTVVVVPDSEDAKPVPSTPTLQVVCAHLNEHRLLTSEVYVVPPVYHRVQIEAQIVARPEADLAEVRRAVEDDVTAFFHPLTGGEEGTGWPFGGDIYFSEIYRVVLRASGVDRVHENQLIIWIDNERQEICRDICLEPGALLYSDGHDIRVTYEVSR